MNSAEHDPPYKLLGKRMLKMTKISVNQSGQFNPCSAEHAPPYEHMGLRCAQPQRPCRRIVIRIS
jgi:hypothetical protein